MVDETYIAQVVAILLFLTAGYFAVRHGFRKWMLSVYLARIPVLDPATVLFCDRWDIGFSEDRNTLFLLRRKEHRAIRVRAVHGYKRIDTGPIERGPAAKFKDSRSPDVLLEFNGNQGREEEPLTYGNSSDSNRIYRYLDHHGIRPLAGRARNRYKR